MNLPMSSSQEGDPCQRVSSAAVACACGCGAATTGPFGRPQCGQAGAAVETSRPQSGQVVNAIATLYCHPERSEVPVWVRKPCLPPTPVPRYARDDIIDDRKFPAGADRDFS